MDRPRRIGSRRPAACEPFRRCPKRSYSPLNVKAQGFRRLAEQKNKGIDERLIPLLFRSFIQRKFEQFDRRIGIIRQRVNRLLCLRGQAAACDVLFRELRLPDDCRLRRFQARISRNSCDEQRTTPPSQDCSGPIIELGGAWVAMAGGLLHIFERGPFSIVV